MLLAAVLWGIVSRLIIGGIGVVILAAIMDAMGMPPGGTLAVSLGLGALVVVYTFIRVATILEGPRQ